MSQMPEQKGFSPVPTGFIHMRDVWPRPKYLTVKPEGVFEHIAFLLQESVGWGECPAQRPFCKNADCYCKLPEKILKVCFPTGLNPVAYPQVMEALKVTLMLLNVPPGSAYLLRPESAEYEGKSWKEMIDTAKQALTLAVEQQP